MMVEVEKIKENKKIKNQTYWGGVLERFRKDKKAVISFIILLVIILSCVIIP